MINHTAAWIVVFSGWLIQTSEAADPLPQLWAPQSGDVLVFVGDRVTERSLYTQYLENYFLTRYPGRDLKIVAFGDGQNRRRQQHRPGADTGDPCRRLGRAANPFQYRGVVDLAPRAAPEKFVGRE